jgi:hypothetical protein
MTIKRSFGKYLEKEIIDLIVNNKEIINRVETKKCGYIIIDIEQNECFENNLNKIIEYFIDKKYVIDVFGTITQFSLYEINENFIVEINIEKIKNDIENIPENINKNIRGIYGIEDARIGNFGNKYRMSYMALLKNYFNKIYKINEIKYGEIKAF